MRIPVTFHSYFRDLTGCSNFALEVPGETSLRDVVRELQNRFPKLKPMERSTLVAVGVEYQPGEYVLKEGDEVSLFPPVQGG